MTSYDANADPRWAALIEKYGLRILTAEPCGAPEEVKAHVRMYGLSDDESQMMTCGLIYWSVTLNAGGNTRTVTTARSEDQQGAPPNIVEAIWRLGAATTIVRIVRIWARDADCTEIEAFADKEGCNVTEDVETAWAGIRKSYDSLHALVGDDGMQEIDALTTRLAKDEIDALRRESSQRYIQ